jgi:hypothetical protein
MFAGQVTTGTSVSVIATVKLQAFVLPAASVAMQATVFVPMGKLAPLAGIQLTVAPGQLSVVVTA